MIDQERGVKAVDLDEVADELVDETGGGAGVRAVDSLLLAEFVEEGAGLLGGEGVPLGQLDSQHLLQSLHHGDAAEGRREVYLDHVILVLRPVRVVLDLVRTVDLEDHLR